MFTSEVNEKTVKFTNKSTDTDGDELTYSWDFGDGNTSTDKNPSHTYESNGKYTVELTVSDGQDSDTFSKEFNIGSNNPPVASFTSKADGKTVKFTNNSSDPDGDKLTYSWDFGDGKTSTDENPSHEYATSGKYTVTLTVSDGDLKNEKTATVNIAPGPDGRICPESDPYCNGSSVIQCAEVCTTEQKEICTGDDVVVSGAISDDYHATNPGGKLGVGLWGDPPELDVANMLKVNTSSVSPYVYITQWTESDPSVLWTKASALFMPVLYNPNSLFIASVQE